MKIRSDVRFALQHSLTRVAESLSAGCRLTGTTLTWTVQ